ncbi:MAG: MFS transporter [Candidatus Firestonebacteria bacterium]
MFINDLGNLIESIFKKPADILDYQQLKLKELFSGLKGNARIMVLSMPAFSFPQAWFYFYQPLFFLTVGIKEGELGLFTSLAIGSQVVGQLIGPFFINKFGHKNTLNTVGLIAWPAGLLLLGFAQNIWWIIPGVIFSNIVFMTTPAWSCLFVEGSTSRGRRNNYAIVQMIISGAALTMPIAGQMVKWLDVNLATRIFFIFGAVSAAWAALYRQKHLTETKEGKAAVLEYRGLNVAREVRDFVTAFKDFGRKKDLFWFIIVQVLFTFGLTMWGVYNAVFLCSSKGGVGLEKSEISIFPILMSITFIFTVLVLIPLIKKSETKKYILAGIILNAAAVFLYVITPNKGMSFIAVSYLLFGLGVAFFRPLSDSSIMNLLSETKRVRLLSLSNTLVLLVSLAAGPVSMALYLISPALNFLAVTVIFMAAALILWKKCRL